MPAEGQSGRSSPRRILFVMYGLGYLRFYQGVLDELLERGHEVHLMLEAPPQRAPEQRWLEGMTGHPRFTWSRTRGLDRDPWRPLAKRLRRSADYARFLGPWFSHAPLLVRRAELRAPKVARRLLGTRIARSSLVLPVVTAVLEELDSALPISPVLRAEIEQANPDVLVLSPYLMPGSRNSEYIRAARSLGIRACTAIASWDHLSSKQRLREHGDSLLVWNELQKGEAIAIHGVPEDRIAVTGAQNFDHWFDWRPGPRDDFCERVGLDPEKPYVLFVGSSLLRGETNEASFVARWLAALRASGDPLLEEAGVLVRPHPKRWDEWDDVTFDDRELGPVVVWPSASREMPVDPSDRADFYDSIYHSAVVVGLNTSAMIEAAIVGRSVHTILPAEFASSQKGVSHFEYLLSAGGGVVIPSHTLTEHVTQLADVLHGRDEGAAQERNRRFLEAFVRPHGLDLPATPVFVDEIERVAALGRTTPLRARRRHFFLRLLLAPALPFARATGLRGGLGEIRKSARRLRMRLGASAVRSARLLRAPAPARRKRARAQARKERTILFQLPYPGYLRMYGSTVRLLAERGNRVLLAYDSEKRSESAVQQFMGSERVEVIEPVPWKPDARAKRLGRFRRAVDYLRYSEPRFRGAPYLQKRMEKYVPKRVRLLRHVPPPLLRVLIRGLLAADRRTAASPKTVAFLERRNVDPDVVIVSPGIARGASTVRQTETVKAAKQLGIPVAIGVASWDHLTTKGLVKVLPDRVFVWNDVQRREAVELHGVPGSLIVTTGAQLFDQWFDGGPALTREEFLGPLGLDPAEPYVLFVGSSPNISPPVREVEFVRLWVDALRSSGPDLARLGVFVRPHPGNTEHWAGVELGLPRVVVAPRVRPAIPMSAEDEALYSHSIAYSAAVVGINTSAIIESLIQRRPVLTINDGTFQETQEGTLHFHYLLDRSGGCVLEAASIPQHVEQLRETLAHPERHHAPIEAFLRSFVRPHGLDRAATPILADEIERLARG